MPSKKLLFGFCKRILRHESSPLYQHLDGYEEEINLLSLTPLPFLVFSIAWLISWIISRPDTYEVIHYVLPGSVLPIVTAILCLIPLQPLQIAERKETIESFLAYKFEKERESNKSFGVTEEDEGVVIPKRLLKGVTEVEIRQAGDVVVVFPKSKEDSLFKLGRNPVACNTPDASENLDKYIY